LLKSASAAKRCPILFAEDSPDDAFFMQLALEKAALPNPLFVVCDGQEVIDYLEGAPPFTDRNLHPPPALVLLDIGMPRRDGFDVLSWLQTRPDLDHIPVVVFTAYDNQSDRDKAFTMGAHAFHVKSASPRQHDALIQTLCELLADQQSRVARPNRERRVEPPSNEQYAQDSARTVQSSTFDFDCI
jgi:CheY-like chemotaxis protein